MREEHVSCTENDLFDYGQTLLEEEPYHAIRGNEALLQKAVKNPNHATAEKMQGVYFLEDFDISLWWANDIANKDKNFGSCAIVYKADIMAKSSEILNLDNKDELDAFYTVILEMASEIEQCASKKMPVFTEDKIRAVYFDYYKEHFNKSVIIYTFQKDCVRYESTRSKNELGKQRKLADSLGLFFKEKQICVSNKKCIKNIEMVYNGEDEVI